MADSHWWDFMVQKGHAERLGALRLCRYVLWGRFTMSWRNFGRAMLVVTLCGVSHDAAVAAGPLRNPQQPVATAAKPKVGQTAHPAQSASYQVGSAAPGALPGAAPATLWRFMGIPQGIQKLQGATTNRRGNFPGREPTPPLKAIADPRNLEPGNGLAINKAAEIKQQEDLAPQKIKALKYLATIGCGCYPGVEEAFAKSLKFGDECTEEVRYEAAKAMKKAAENNCAVCGKSCCCTAAMMQLLNDIATGKDDDGCFLEPSARVREAACEALLACRQRVRVAPAPAVAPPVVPPVPGPQEYIPSQPTPEEISPPRTTAVGHGDGLMDDILGTPGSRDPRQAVRATNVSTRNTVQGQNGGAGAATPGLNTMLAGSVVGVDITAATLDLEFQGRFQPTVGSHFSIHHDYAAATAYLGRVEIVYRAANGRVVARAVGRTDLTKVHRGDRVSGRIVECKDEDYDGTAATQSRPAAGLALKSWLARPAVARRSSPAAVNPVSSQGATGDDAASDENGNDDLGSLRRFPWLFGKTRQSAEADDDASEGLPVAQTSSAGMLFEE